MNLKDRQKTEDYKQPAEQEKKENKIQNSNDTTEKYRKLSQEQSKVIQTLQEQISDLTKNGKEEDQKKIQKLSSQISEMQNELQSRSETIISQNETIAKLSESDKVLKENERLKKLNSELQESEQNTRKEAEEEVAAVKSDYENRAHDMAIHEEDISSREKRVTVRENNIREEIAVKAEQMIRDRKKSLENEQQNRMAKLENSYRSQVKELENNYQRMTLGYRSIFYITLFYGMLTTFLMIIRTETIREDFMLFLNMIEKAAKSVYGWSVTAGTFAARLGDMISQPVIATIVHGILLILVVVVIIGGLGVLLALCGKRYIDFFRENKQMKYQYLWY